ncbi:MAG: hypothetical protein VB125_02530, partial [Burkholderia sp.]
MHNIGAVPLLEIRVSTYILIFSGKMRKNTTNKQAEPKGKYRVKNWAQYNAGLIARGDVTMWIDPNLFAAA